MNHAIDRADAPEMPMRRFGLDDLQFRKIKDTLAGELCAQFFLRAHRRDDLRDPVIAKCSKDESAADESGGSGDEDAHGQSDFSQMV
jgi:hypothetical protein